MPDNPYDAIVAAASPDPSERVRRIATRAQISPEIADDYLKTTQIESGHNVHVRDSPKGAQGFGQVMPDVKGGSTRTVGGRKYNLRNPDENIEAGLRYFAEGGSDPVARRLYYFGGPGAKRHYEKTGKIPNISDGNMTASQYVKATGAAQNPYDRVVQSAEAIQPKAKGDPYDSIVAASQPQIKQVVPRIEPKIDWSKPEQVKAYVESLAGPQVQRQARQIARRQVQSSVDADRLGARLSGQSTADTGVFKRGQPVAPPEFSFKAPPPQLTGVPGLGSLQRTRQKIASGQVDSNERQRLINQHKAELEQSQAPLELGFVSGPDPRTSDRYQAEAERRADEELATRARLQSPEIVAGRKELGRMSATERSYGAPALRVAAGLLKSLAGANPALAGIEKVTGRSLTNYLQKKGQAIEDIASAPLNEQGQAIVRSVPEKLATSLADLGFTVVTIAAAQKATGLPMSQIMAIESAVKTSDLPAKERAVEVAKAYGMGKVLDSHLSRPASALLFGGPTALQTGAAVSRGDMTLGDALLETGVQTAAGAILSGGKPKPRAEGRPLVPVETQERLQRGEQQAATDRVVGDLEQQGATVLSGGIRPKLRIPTEGIETSEIETQPQVAANLEVPEPAASSRRGAADTSLAQPKMPEVEVVQGTESDSLSAPRHVDLQARRKRGPNAGDFRKETKAETEERRAQVTGQIEQGAATQPSVEPLTTAESGSPTDVEGNPLTVYHGTKGNFETFDPKLLGSNTGAESAKGGFYFASNPEATSNFTEGGGRVVPAHLNITDPKVVEFEQRGEGSIADWIKQAKSEGKDGLVLKNWYEGGKKGSFEQTDIFVAFKPEQIKSTSPPSQPVRPEATGRARLGDRSDYDRLYPPGSEKRADYEAESRKVMDEQFRKSQGEGRPPFTDAQVDAMRKEAAELRPQIFTKSGERRKRIAPDVARRWAELEASHKQWRDFGRKQEATTPVIRSSADVKSAMQKHFNLPEEQADAVSRIADARAETWAKQSGKPKEEWYKTRIVDITKGEPAEGALYQKAPDTPQFKRWFGDSKVVNEKGEPLVLYSGHGNLDLYGDAYDPKRGTAGGFYATEDPAIASNYATGKLGEKEYYENGDQYRFQLKNGKFNKKLWQMELSPEQQAKVREFMADENLGGGSYDIEQYWKDNAQYDKDARRALARGGLRDLHSIWQFLEYMGENIAYAKEGDAPYFQRQTSSTFEKILDHLGIPWKSKLWSQPGVVPVHLRIRNPLDASKPFPPDLLAALKREARYERTVADSSDRHWTKDFPLKEWIRSIEDGNEYWSTQIPKKALPVLKRFGYDGIKETGLKGSEGPRQVNWIAFDPEQIKSATGNRGAFDPNDPNILHQSNKASTEFLDDNRAIIRGLQKPDISSAAHEIAHVFRRDLDGNLLKSAERWAGVQNGEWKVPHEEKFARGFERYLREGKAPTEQLRQVFAQFKEWLTNIYKTIKGSPIEGKLSPEIRSVFDELLGGERTTSEPSTTSARKGMMAEDRAALDLPELPLAERKSWQTSLDNAKPEKASLLADEVLNKPRGLNDEETASLVVRAQQIKNEHSQVMKEIGDATDPDVISAKRSQAEALEREFDKITKATKASGTEKGRALASQKLTINQDFDLVSMIQRAKAAKGRDLTSDERQRYEQQSTRITELEAQFTKAQDAAKTRNLQREISRTMRKYQRGVTKSVLDDEFASLRADLAKVKLEIKESPIEYRQGGVGFASFDPSGKLTPIISRMARNRIKAGVTDAAQLVDDIHAAVVEHIEGITKREIRDAISGYGLQGKDRRSEIVKQLAAIRSELQGLSKQEDVQAGIRSQRKEGPRLSDVNKLPAAGPRKSDARSSGIPLQGPHLSDVKKVPMLGPRMSEASRSGVPLAGPKRSEAKRLPAEGPKLSESTTGRQYAGPEKAEAYKLPAEGPPKQIFTRNKVRRNQLLKLEAELQRRLEQQDFSPTLKREAPLYTRETLALTKQVEAIKRRYNQELYRATRGTMGRIFDEAAKFGNVPKTLKSMGDISAVFRQGGFYSLARPVEGFAKPFRDMVKSFSEVGFRNVESAIKNDPNFDLARRSGIEFTGVDKNDPNLSKHEEGYLGGEYIDYIPVAKQVKDFSERTFVSFLDSQRMHVFNQMAKGLESQGITPRTNPEAYKAAAKLVNIGTGRGNLGRKGNQAAPLLNLAMFSPRLVASRVQLLNKMFNPVAMAQMPKGTRAMMIKDNVKFLAATAAIIGLAKAAGGTVNTDPDDGDFLKIRFGDTTYDTLTGLQQPLRLILNLGYAVKADIAKDATYTGKDKSELISRFARSKLSPLAGVATDYTTGKDFEGRKFSPLRAARDLITPLPASDFIDAMKQEGLIKGFAKALPSLTGVGVQTYPQPPEKPTTKGEKLARKFVRDSMPDDARTDEEIDRSQKVSAMRLRSRKGEDVSADLKSLGLSPRQEKSILSARGKTRLQEDFKRLRLFDKGTRKDALTVYSTLSPAEKAAVKEELESKAQTINLLPADDQAEVKKQLESIGMKPGFPVRKPREARQPRQPRQPGYVFQ